MVSPPQGLTSEEALRRLRELGANAVPDEAQPQSLRFLAKLWSPVPWMLEATIALQLALGKYLEAAVVGGLLIFNTVLGFIQEGQAGAALEALKKRLAPTALVCRDGDWVRLPVSQIVPGDAIRLPLGAIVPADATIASGSVLVDQSMLTGESVPVEAGAGNRVFASSLVRRGQAVAVVTATGAKTYFGRAAELVRIAHAKSSEQSAVFAVTRNLAVVNGSVAALLVAYAVFVVARPPSEVISFALTALLATIPVALPATFTLSAALSAVSLAKRGVLLTRLTAAHEAASMDVLCADKTGTLTRNALEVLDVIAMTGFDRKHVLELAALASSEADQDPIDAAVRKAAAATGPNSIEKPLRFIPFDPTTKTSEATIVDSTGREQRIVKGAFETVVAQMTEAPAEVSRTVNELSGQGHRVIAVAAGHPSSLHLAGLIALSDPPRDDSARLVAALRDMSIRTIMVTGDSPVTAAAIAGQVGIRGTVYPSDRISPDAVTNDVGIFARVVPEDKYALVKALQARGHTVGMCGDGTNDAPALRQAQIGIAVSSATDVAKAAAGMVMTEPGLAGIVLAIREGRVGFQRLLAYTFNMLVKKIEIVLFLAVGFVVTGHAVMTPALMVLLLITNDFLSMSLTTDRAKPASTPRIWRMRNVTEAAVILGFAKLAFSTAILGLGAFWFGLRTPELQTLAFVTLVFGNQAVMYALRERHRLWSSMPSPWVLASSAVDVTIASTLAFAGILMTPLPWEFVVSIFAAAVVFAVIFDQIKLPVAAALKVG